MLKKGPISRVEKFYIDGHINDPVESIAKEIDRSVKFVENYVKANVGTKSTIAEVKSTINVNKDQFARRKGSVVMTELASEISDDVRKQVGISAPQTKDYITKIRNDS